MANRELEGMPVGLEPYIDKVCEIIQKALADAGLQAKIYQSCPGIKQETADVWYTDIDVRLLLGVSVRVEPIGRVNINDG